MATNLNYFMSVGGHNINGKRGKLAAKLFFFYDSAILFLFFHDLWKWNVIKKLSELDSY